MTRFYSCETHAKPFVKDVYDTAKGIIHSHFECGCTQVLVITDVVSVGDAVLYDGDLFRVDGHLHSRMGDVAMLSNAEGESAARWHELTYVAVDKLSGLGAKREYLETPVRSHRYDQPWDPDTGYGYAPERTCTPIRNSNGSNKITTKTNIVKKGPVDSISTGSLITKEIEKLEGEKSPDVITSFSEYQPNTSNEVRPLRSKKTKKDTKDKPSDEFKSPIQRKGDGW